MDGTGNEKRRQEEMEKEVAATNSSSNSSEDGTLNGGLERLRGPSDGRWGEEQDGGAVDVASAIGGFEECAPRHSHHNPL